MDEPAFPHVNFMGQKITGMTLRDYFAAKAMQVLARGLAYSETAEAAYKLADKMMKEREK